MSNTKTQLLDEIKKQQAKPSTTDEKSIARVVFTALGLSAFVIMLAYYNYYLLAPHLSTL